MKSISPKRKYKLAEAAELVSPIMPKYLFYSLLREKRRAEKAHTAGGLAHDLTGAELLEIIRQAGEQKVTRAGGGTQRTAVAARVQDRPHTTAPMQVTPPPKAAEPPPVVVPPIATPPDERVIFAPRWAWQILDRPDEPRECSPAILAYLDRAEKVFAQLPNGSWYIRRQKEVAAGVKPVKGVSFIRHLLSKRGPVETAELIGVEANSWADDEIDAYNTFGTRGWNVTRLFDDERVYDKVCKRFKGAIRAIGKANAELGRYFQLVIQRPAENGEGWILHDQDPGEWILDTSSGGTDAAMHKLGDSWLLRWGDSQCRLPNQRIGIESAARIVQCGSTGVPCCLLRDPDLPKKLNSAVDLPSLVAIIRKHVQRKDCQPPNKRDSHLPQGAVLRLIAALDRKGAEALLDGRGTDALEITGASANLKAALDTHSTRQRMVPLLDELNTQGRTHVKKNLDSAIEFMRCNGASQMADHLATHIETGEVCYYSGPLIWDVQGLNPFPCIATLAADRVFGVRPFLC